MLMDLSPTLRFRPTPFSLSCQRLHSPITHSLKPGFPSFAVPKLGLNAPSFSRTTKRSAALVVTAGIKEPIEGVSKELNSIASRNLDHATARRRVRSAFIEVQQELDHPLFKMAPAGIKTEEWFQVNSDGVEVFCKSWMPGQGAQLKGSVFFCHGYGDTCTFFFEGIAKRIAASGYGVFSLDHPGFGLSEGLHGYVPSFNGLVDNVIEQFTKIKGRPEFKGLPQFLLGQSMGGAVALKVGIKEPEKWDGVVLVAPMCKVSESLMPPAAVMEVFTLMSKVMPKAKLLPERDLDALMFRDPKKRKMAVYNVICYNDQMRLKTGMELLKATKDIEEQVIKVSSPLLILHGAEDKVTDPTVSQFLYANASSKDKTLKLYEDGFHCILEGEPDKRIIEVLDDIVEWLDSRSSTH